LSSRQNRLTVIAIQNQQLSEPSAGSLLGDQLLSFSATLMIRLNRSKCSSEMFGHLLVDEVMSLVIQRTQSALRSQDQCFSVAPDQIAVIFDFFGSSDALDIAHSLLDLIQRAYVIQGQVMFLSASIGIAPASQGGTESQTLLKRAGIALWHSRLAGPGTITVFRADMERRMMEQHSLSSDLRKALALRQFEVHYQPQIHLRSRQLTGFEALLRWRHPELGWVSPAVFIPLAEEIGIIEQIGSWVLWIACRQAALLPESIVVAVNASPLQLRNGSLLGAVTRALSIAALPATRLEIEVTEGVLLDHSHLVRSTLDTLHSMGVRLAIDDFGSGYSSLGQLAQLPFDTIKIDRSLLGNNIKNRTITRAIAMLGTGLGMTVLAEGIENEEELANVDADGCSSAQGYLFGKALPADRLNEAFERLFSEAGAEQAHG
jgi:diguanylate cyclase (GGDEF)-like protein